ncbi:hypothetical protein C8R45DRAFT_1224884 [Mycena sanguinolenta]|nr:hypothetical protein C8R45DRAFT_1224884 [Mycena sanguinolenta]
MRVPQANWLTLSSITSTTTPPTWIFNKVEILPPKNRDDEDSPCGKFHKLLTRSPHIASLVDELQILLVGSETSFAYDEDGNYLEERQGPWVMSGRTLSLVLALLNLRGISLIENSPPVWNEYGAFSMHWNRLGRSLKSALAAVFSSPKLEMVRLRGIVVESPTQLLALFSEATSLKEMSISRVHFTHIRDEPTPWPESQVWHPQLHSLLVSDISTIGRNDDSGQTQAAISGVTQHLTLYKPRWDANALTSILTPTNSPLERIVFEGPIETLRLLRGQDLAIDARIGSAIAHLSVLKSVEMRAYTWTGEHNDIRFHKWADDIRVALPSLAGCGRLILTKIASPCTREGAAGLANGALEVAQRAARMRWGSRLVCIGLTTWDGTRASTVAFGQRATRLQRAGDARASLADGAASSNSRLMEMRTYRWRLPPTHDSQTACTDVRGGGRHTGTAAHEPRSRETLSLDGEHTRPHRVRLPSREPCSRNVAVAVGRARDAGATYRLCGAARLRTSPTRDSILTRSRFPVRLTTNRMRSAPAHQSKLCTVPVHLVPTPDSCENGGVHTAAASAQRLELANFDYGRDHIVGAAQSVRRVRDASVDASVQAVEGDIQCEGEDGGRERERPRGYSGMGPNFYWVLTVETQRLRLGDAANAAGMARGGGGGARGVALTRVQAADASTQRVGGARGEL